MSLKRILVALCVLVFAALGAMSGVLFVRDKGAVSIHFVIPDGFQGIVQVACDANAGKAVERGNDGTYRLNIPESGRTVVESTRVFQEWHRTTCATASGVVVPVASGEGTLIDDAVALRHVFDIGNRDGTQDVFVVVGTDADRMVAEKSILETRPIPFADDDGWK